jgi:hypothetical protein
MLIISLIILLSLLIFYYLCTNNRLIENNTNGKDTNGKNTNEKNTNGKNTDANKVNEDDEDDVPKYQEYTDLKNNNKTGPLFLALKNAANISSLHSKISGLNNLKEKINVIDSKVNLNGKALTQLSNHLSKISQTFTGKTPQKK